ncbi:hypothetical protein BX600DRAFT_506984 [Xylariales sp. PMI_506]|nr:hypothetical protein BX600DRAFT_506984 [Xylariales sp. PMI_506]
MSPKKTSDIGPGLSEQESRVFLSVITNMVSKLEVDWDTVAKESGYASASCAQSRFIQIKKKYAKQFTNNKATSSIRITKVKKPMKSQVSAAKKVPITNKHTYKEDAASLQYEAGVKPEPNIKTEVKSKDSQDDEYYGFGKTSKRSSIFDP